MTLRFCQDCGRQVTPARPCKCHGRHFSPSPPFHSRVYCRVCQTSTRWRRINFSNGDSPPVLSWECETCGSSRYQYADCTNVETMCQTVLEENLRRTGANLDYDEALARLGLEAWRAYKNWKPGGMNFEGWAFEILRRRAYDYYRQELGRRGEKPLANAVHLPDGEWDSELLPLAVAEADDLSMRAALSF